MSIQKYFLFANFSLLAFLSNMFSVGTGTITHEPSSVSHVTDSSLLYIVKKCSDFEVNGSGDNKEWDKAVWAPFTLLQKGGLPYASKSKMMYSDKGLYLLFSGEDKKITTQNWKDFENIYDGDVFEVFFHPDPAKPPYFEYEINPLRKELTLTLARFGKNAMAWSPWSGENKEDKLIKREVKINGGKQEIGASITSWSAEVFFPYQVLALLPNSPPTSGTVWDANFCRIDYDDGKQNEYSWSPTMVTGFHELKHFQKIKFE